VLKIIEERALSLLSGLASDVVWVAFQ